MIFFPFWLAFEAIRPSPPTDLILLSAPHPDLAALLALLLVWFVLVPVPDPAFASLSDPQLFLMLLLSLILPLLVMLLLLCSGNVV